MQISYRVNCVKVEKIWHSIKCNKNFNANCVRVRRLCAVKLFLFQSNA